MNTVLFAKNKDTKSNISIIPTPVRTGEEEDISDILLLLISQVKTRMLKKVRYEEKMGWMVKKRRSEEGQARQ